MEKKNVNTEKMESLRSDAFVPLTIEERKRLVGGMIKLVTKTETPEGGYERDDDI